LTFINGFVNVYLLRLRKGEREMNKKRKLRMIYSLGAYKIQTFSVSNIAEIIEACKTVREFRDQHMFIFKLGNRYG
jgi:hypothetical protein